MCLAAAARTRPPARKWLRVCGISRPARTSGGRHWPRRQLHERQEQRQQAQARGIEKARQRAQAEHALKSTQKPRERPAQPSPTPRTSNPTQSHQRATEPPAEPSERLSLDDKKRLPDAVLGERGKLEKPWQRASLSNDNKRPWQRDDKPAGRERSPSRPKTPKR